LTAVGDAAGRAASDRAEASNEPDDVPQRAGGKGPPSAAHLEAAEALRQLGHAIVAHDVDDGMFLRITSQVEELLAVIDATPERVRAPLDMVHAVFVAPPPDGRGRTNFPYDIVTGKANPLGIAADISREGDEAVLRTTLGPAFEGAPGRAHGGVVAALIDEVMGFVLSINATTAYTGRLTVTYRAPTPLGVEIEMRAKLHRHHGRKLHIEANAYHGTVLLAHGEGLFITVDPDSFAAG
jgi:acyl-coenzyme A thioesterase PaaI-like protein